MTDKPYIPRNCFECGKPCGLRDGWDHCFACGWDWQEELKEKIRQQLANDPKCYD